MLHSRFENYRSHGNLAVYPRLFCTRALRTRGKSLSCASPMHRVRRDALAFLGTWLNATQPSPLAPHPVQGARTKSHGDPPPSSYTRPPLLPGPPPEPARAQPSPAHMSPRTTARSRTHAHRQAAADILGRSGPGHTVIPRNSDGAGGRRSLERAPAGLEAARWPTGPGPSASGRAGRSFAQSRGGRGAASQHKELSLRWSKIITLVANVSLRTALRVP